MKAENVLPEILKDLYYRMLKIRLVSEKIIELYPEQEMRCPTHLSIGEEAIAAGICQLLGPTDAVFSHHRCHAHYLAMGGSIKEMLAELYGKVTGCSRGIGGSMHLTAPQTGFIAASSIVGGTIPIATGAALAFQKRDEKRVAISFFGDGGADEGVFFESLNYASLKNLPIVFVCENNFYAVLSRLEARRKNMDIFTHAAAFNMPGQAVDGNDVLAVYQAGQEAIARARFGNGPTLLECRTYRWREHVGPNCDQEHGHRPACEVSDWMKHCPVRTFEDYLLSEQILSLDEKNKITKDLSEEIEGAVNFAKNSPFPSQEDLLKFVYPV
ncbi:MAG: thiamine pyrophosphate-dependent dehydrogenase E1 component subunit alpha [Patescibacteria group bacterium]